PDEQSRRAEEGLHLAVATERFQGDRLRNSRHACRYGETRIADKSYARRRIFIVESSRRTSTALAQTPSRFRLHRGRGVSKYYNFLAHTARGGRSRQHRHTREGGRGSEAGNDLDPCDAGTGGTSDRKCAIARADSWRTIRSSKSDRHGACFRCDIRWTRTLRHDSA